MKRNEKRDTGLLAFTAFYSVIMISVLTATVLIFSQKKENGPQVVTQRVVETEYVYVTEASSEEREDILSDITDVAASAPEALLVKEYLGKIGIFNSEGEAIYVIDTHTKTLPQADQRLLEEGFEITDERQLAAIIQDYSS